MKVVAGGNINTLGEVPEAARQAEELGYDVFTSAENRHNPFLPLVLAAEHTQRVALRTSIVLAFPRSPMTVAGAAWDLQAYSGGRFHLGLGSQVRGHIVRRFSTPWTPPAPRMREYVQALRAIWDCFQDGTQLNFQGDYYSFTLMTPFFNPGPIEHPNIPVYLSALNPYMLRVAGEVCDGIPLLGFNTPKFTQEVILPNLEAGAKRAGRSLKDIDIIAGGFIITGENEEEVQKNKQAARTQLAFYGSTRSYSLVLKTHGWDDTFEKLYSMSVNGQWESMSNEITEDMLNEFTIVGTYDDIVPKIKARFGGYATSISFSIPIRKPEDKERLQEMIKELQED